MARSIRNRSFSRRSRRSSSVSGWPCPLPGNACPGLWANFCLHRPNIVSLMPKSRATCATLPRPSGSSRTASTLNSFVKLLCGLPIDTSLSTLSILNEVSTKPGEDHPTPRFLATLFWSREIYSQFHSQFTKANVEAPPFGRGGNIQSAGGRSRL